MTYYTTYLISVATEVHAYTTNMYYDILYNVPDFSSNLFELCRIPWLHRNTSSLNCARQPGFSEQHCRIYEYEGMHVVRFSKRKKRKPRWNHFSHLALISALFTTYIRLHFFGYIFGCVLVVFSFSLDSKHCPLGIKFIIKRN